MRETAMFATKYNIEGEVSIMVSVKARQGENVDTLIKRFMEAVKQDGILEDWKNARLTPKDKKKVKRA